MAKSKDGYTPGPALVDEEPPENTKSYKTGQVIGKGLGAVGTGLNKTGIPRQLSKAGSAVSRGYESKTGRSSSTDGKVAGTAAGAVVLVGAAVATVVVAAPAVIVGAAVGAAGLAGAAVAKAKGHGGKVDTVTGAIKKGGRTTGNMMKNVYRGVKSGASGNKPNQQLDGQMVVHPKTAPRSSSVHTSRVTSKSKSSTKSSKSESNAASSSYGDRQDDFFASLKQQY